MQKMRQQQAPVGFGGYGQYGEAARPEGQIQPAQPQI